VATSDSAAFHSAFYAAVKAVLSRFRKVLYSTFDIRPALPRVCVLVVASPDAIEFFASNLHNFIVVLMLALYLFLGMKRVYHENTGRTFAKFLVMAFSY